MCSSSLPKYLWSVGGSHEQHPPFGTAGVAAFHLHQHLCLQPPAGLMLTCDTPYTLFTCAAKDFCQLQKLGFSCMSASGFCAACRNKWLCCLHGVTLLACRHFSQICPVWSCQELVLHVPSPSSARKCKHCCCCDCSCGGLSCHQETSTHAMKLLFDLLCC